MTQASAIDSDSVATVAAPSGLRRYSPLAMTLHWVMAALILFAVVHGLLLESRRSVGSVSRRKRSAARTLI